MIQHLLSKKDVADYCGFSTRKLNRHMRKREIDFVKFGKMVKFKLPDVDCFIERHRIKTRHV